MKLFSLFHLLVFLVVIPFVISQQQQPPPNIWPLPAAYSYGSSNLTISSSFAFVTNVESNILSLGFLRYEVLMFPQGDPSSPTGLASVLVSVASINDTLQYGIDESYTISITQTNVTITANTVYGALRGMETFSQLVLFDFDAQVYYIPNVPWSIKDAPRFSHRGLLIDTSRHYLPKNAILAVLDSMSYAKLNVLHWHIVDAQSFPLEIKSFDRLWLGAWSNNQRYTQTMIQEIVEYAQYLGIRVVPEFDGPGHAYSWGIGYPEILPASYENSTICTENKCPPAYGNPCDVPIDPSNNFTFSVLTGILSECSGEKYGAGLFPDYFIHLGGDEVEESCWENSAQISNFMKENDMTSYDQLYGYYIQRAHNISHRMQRNPVNWEEVFNYFGNSLDKDTIIHVWLDFDTLASVVAAGYRGILSNNAAWYLDHLTTNWTVFYLNEPFTGITDPQQQELVLGGEACMWGETVDASDLLQTIWPRAAATAERLWSPREVNDTTTALPRLEYFRCLLDVRGVPAAPVLQPGRGAPLEPGSCFHQ